MMSENPTQYVFLDGTSVSLLDLLQADTGEVDLAFIMWLMQQAWHEGRSYSGLRARIAGPNAWPLKGSHRVTREIHETLLYRIAEDIVDRAGIKQGALGANPDDKI